MARVLMILVARSGAQVTAAIFSKLLVICEHNWIRTIDGVKRVERRRMKYLGEEVGT